MVLFVGSKDRREGEETMEFRSFTNTDWYGYAGAERFADGTEPQIAEGTLSKGDTDLDVVVVLDANGLQMMVYDEEAQYDGTWSWSYPFAGLAAARVASANTLLDAVLSTPGAEKLDT